MKRFLTTLTLLVLSLFLVVSGVNAALDRLAHAPSQNSFTAYSEQGNVVLAYDGDLNGIKAGAKSGLITIPSFLHRT